jgi:hypothetical protein
MKQESSSLLRVITRTYKTKEGPIERAVLKLGRIVVKTGPLARMGEFETLAEEWGRKVPVITLPMPPPPEKSVNKKSNNNTENQLIP